MDFDPASAGVVTDVDDGGRIPMLNKKKMTEICAYLLFKMFNDQKTCKCETKKNL